MQEQMNSAMETAREAAASVGERVTDFFQGNPFATPCGRKIEMATDASTLATENWGLNMEICDFINNTADGGRDAIRAIRKRLHTQMSKNNAIVMYTLTVLETCVKNCDIRFHELVCQKEFINELVKLIGAKFDAPQVVQERVLSLIQSWNDAFRGDPRLQGVCQVYDELKAKGVEFPMTDFDTMAPIITPKRTVFSSSSNEASRSMNSTNHRTQSNVTSINYQFMDPSHPVQPSAEQMEKLREELDVVNNNLKVLREMLSELAPGKELEEDMKLLVELHDTCVEMQNRIKDLIRCIASDQVTYELLMVNDELNNVFEKYDRYMANRQTGADNTTVTTATTTTTTTTTSTTNKNINNNNNDSVNLIDMDDDTRPLSQQMGALQTHDANTIPNRRDDTNNTKKLEAEYAENSTRLDQTDAGLSKAAFNKTAPISEREAAEMSQWLEAQPTDKPKESDKDKEPKSDANAGL